MSGQVSKSVVERALDLLTIVAVCVFVLTMTGYVRTKVYGTQTDNTVAVGSTLTIPGLEATSNPARKTLVIALQAECEYCEQSMAFYRDLLASNLPPAFSMVAVVPHAKEIGADILKAAGVVGPTVASADFARLKIAATPTLILLDERNVVRNVWVGKLSARSEDLIFSKLGVERRMRTADRREHDSRMREFVEVFRRDVPLIDTRSRAEFKRESITGALNIPANEIDVRLVHEVPANSEVLVYCDRQPQCAVVFENAEMVSPCESAMEAIKNKGFARARLVPESFDELEAAGVVIVRSGEGG